MFVTSLCTSQTTHSLLEDGIGLEANAYYKDTFNELDKFTGTWKYQSGSTVLEIIIQKRNMVFDSYFNNYTDMLIGEYRFVNPNGVQIINTLSALQIALEPFENNIAGAQIMDINMPASERRIKLKFSDPDRKYLKRYIIVKHHASQGNTPETIEIEFTGETSIVPDDNSPTELRVPEQNYTLTKVQ